MQRRKFIELSTIAAGIALFAPSMLLSASRRQQTLTLYGDGLHDDTEALQAWLDGNPVFYPNSKQVGRFIQGGEYRVTDSLDWSRARDRHLNKAKIYLKNPAVIYVNGHISNSFTSNYIIGY